MVNGMKEIRKKLIISCLYYPAKDMPNTFRLTIWLSLVTLLMWYF